MKRYQKPDFNILHFSLADRLTLSGYEGSYEEGIHITQNNKVLYCHLDASGLIIGIWAKAPGQLVKVLAEIKASPCYISGLEGVV